MDASELRPKTSDELKTQLAELRKEQFNLRFQRATNQLENTSRVRLVRRDIARIKTIAAQKRAGDGATKSSDKPKRASRSKAKSE